MNPTNILLFLAALCFALATLAGLEWIRGVSPAWLVPLGLLLSLLSGWSITWRKAP